jgi:hypothetical protein
MPKRKGPLPPRTLALSLPLTERVSPQGFQREITYPGMASWGGAKPGKTCRECNYWNHDGYTVDGFIKMARCLKAVAMLNNKYSMRVPHYASACKYFDEAAQPPSPIKVK